MLCYVMLCYVMLCYELHYVNLNKFLHNLHKKVLYFPLRGGKVVIIHQKPNFTSHDAVISSALFQEDSTSIELINSMKKLEIYPFAWMISTTKL